MFLYPITFDDPSTPHLDYTARYAGSGTGMHEVPPVGVPFYAYQLDPGADLLETSNTGWHDDNYTLSPLPPVDVILAVQAMADPSNQGTKVVPVKLAAEGMIDVGDLIYGTDQPLLTDHLGLVP